MIGFILLIMVLAILLRVGFTITGALLSALFWLCFKLPFALILWSIAILCCCTLILIPVGIGLFKLGLSILIPGHLI